MQNLLRFLPKYGAVSLICVTANNMLLIALDQMGLYYGYSVLISAAIMIPLSYLLQSHFTYEAKRMSSSFLKYALVMLPNTPAAWLLFLLIHDRGGVAMLFAAPVVTVIMFGWNYVGSFWAIAAPRQARPPSA